MRKMKLNIFVFIILTFLRSFRYLFFEIVLRITLRVLRAPFFSSVRLYWIFGQRPAFCFLVTSTTPFPSEQASTPIVFTFTKPDARLE